MSAIRVEEEAETPRGWSFQVTVELPDGSATRHAVRLSWVDYDHWSHGATPPARVVQAVVQFLVDRRAPIPQQFDAATVRRKYADFDDEMSGRP